MSMVRVHPPKPYILNKERRDKKMIGTATRRRDNKTKASRGTVKLCTSCYEEWNLTTLAQLSSNIGKQIRYCPNCGGYLIRK